MFCVNCGKQIEENAAFCSECGSPVNGTGNRATQDTNSNSNLGSSMQQGAFQERNYMTYFRESLGNKEMVGGIIWVCVGGVQILISTITKPSKVTGVKVKKKNTKQITSKSRYNLSWGKVKGADGYEIQGYVSSVYRRSLTTKNIKIKTIKKNSLKNQRIYWYKIYPNAPEENIVSKVRVRAYKVINGKKIYGSYSSWKTILPSKQVKKLQREMTG